jgi:hypothetical protein
MSARGQRTEALTSYCVRSAVASIRSMNSLMFRLAVARLSNSERTLLVPLGGVGPEFERDVGACAAACSDLSAVEGSFRVSNQPLRVAGAPSSPTRQRRVARDGRRMAS